jgi:hypothetical protein
LLFFAQIFGLVSQDSTSLLASLANMYGCSWFFFFSPNGNKRQEIVEQLLDGSEDLEGSDNCSQEIVTRASREIVLDIFLVFILLWKIG